VNYVMTFMEEWNFSDARNAANQAASGEWILSLDTDEIIIQSQFDRIVELVKSEKVDEVVGVGLKVYSRVRDTPDYVLGNIVRLFRNDVRIIWKCAIHESVMFSILEQNLRTIDTNIGIFHTGYDLESDVIKSKLERNLELLCREYAKRNISSIMKNALKNKLFETVKQLEVIQNA